MGRVRAVVQAAAESDGWAASRSTHRAVFPHQSFPLHRWLPLESIGQPSGCIRAIFDQAAPPANLQTEGIGEDVVEERAAALRRRQWCVGEDVETERAAASGEDGGIVCITPDLQ
jgi:hypothetical protein